MIAAPAAKKKWTDRIRAWSTSITFTSCTRISSGTKSDRASATTVVRQRRPTSLSAAAAVAHVAESPKPITGASLWKTRGAAGRVAP